MVTIESLAPWIGGALIIGGVAAVLSRRRELMLRWCFWAVAVPIVVGLFWWGKPGVAILAIIVGVIAVVEFGMLMHLGWLDRVAMAAAFISVVLAVWLLPEHTVRIFAIGLLAVVAVPLVAGDATHGLRRASAGVLGLAWLSPLAGLIPLGPTALALFVGVSIADIVAFFAGPRLGGPRLSPLSPAKRWSGTLAGAAAGVGSLALIGALSWPTALAVAVGGPAGDLLESMIKRGVRAKDSGSWIANAGGILDRIDSMLVAVALMLVLR
jgi:phosphatidate cytidylyltransferase